MPKTGSNKPQPTKILILESARYILSEKGHSSFSMRAVAKQAGVILRTVQYYFPKKKDLLNAVLEYTLQHYYVSQYPLARQNFKKLDVINRFESMIGYLMDDLRDPTVGRFFPEIWALASRDEDAAVALDNFYTQHRRYFAELIHQLNPELPLNKVTQRAAIIAMMIEGLLLIVGNGKPLHSELKGLKKEVILQAKVIATQSA